MEHAVKHAYFNLSKCLLIPHCILTCEIIVMYPTDVVLMIPGRNAAFQPVPHRSYFKLFLFGLLPWYFLSIKDL